MIYMNEAYVVYHSIEWNNLILMNYNTWSVDENNVALMKKTIY